MKAIWKKLKKRQFNRQQTMGNGQYAIGNTRMRHPKMAGAALILQCIGHHLQRNNIFCYIVAAFVGVALNIVKRIAEHFVCFLSIFIIEEDFCRLVEMVLGAYQSARSGQRVHFPLA